MDNFLDAPITRLGISDDDAKKVSEGLQVETVRDLALNQHFLLAQNCYLIAETNAKPRDLNEKKHPFFELVASIAGATVLLGALLYLAGWSYLYQYYKSFGVRVSELNLPFYDALIYSLTVIFKGYWSALLLLLLIVVVGVVLGTEWISQKMLTPVGVGVALILILLVGYGLSRRGADLGQEHAREDMREDTENLPNVWLNLATPAGPKHYKIPRNEVDKDEINSLRYNQGPPDLDLRAYEIPRETWTAMNLRIKVPVAQAKESTTSVTATKARESQPVNAITTDLTKPTAGRESAIRRVNVAVGRDILTLKTNAEETGTLIRMTSSTVFFRNNGKTSDTPYIRDDVRSVKVTPLE